MTIEERLEKLAERHEALSQTVELILGMQRDNEQRFRENQQLYEQRFRENEQRFTLVTRNFEVVLDSIKSLEKIAGAHEQRLDDLQNQ